jgi:hypothetical protein
VTGVLTIKVPAEDVVHELTAVILAVPLLLGFVVPTLLVKEHVGLVFKLKVVFPATIGVPEAES